MFYLKEDISFSLRTTTFLLPALSAAKNTLLISRVFSKTV